MNKSRIEAFSDGVFAIAFTILVLELKVPEHIGNIDAQTLYNELISRASVFFAYVVSFAILAVYWISHHYLFHAFAKSVNRQLNLLNMFYLMSISLVPFSAHLLGTYPHNVTAVVWYGLNMLFISGTTVATLFYVLRTPALKHEGLTSRTITQARIRQSLNVIFSILGILVAPWSTNFSVFLFAFPIVYNLIPGSLDAVEKILGIEIK